VNRANVSSQGTSYGKEVSTDKVWIDRHLLTLSKQRTHGSPSERRRTGVSSLLGPGQRPRTLEHSVFLGLCVHTIVDVLVDLEVGFPKKVVPEMEGMMLGSEDLV
jgi:hypothetical protein